MNIQKKRDYIKQILSNNKRYYKEKNVLKNISFSLERGDALGIIGKMGVGRVHFFN